MSVTDLRTAERIDLGGPDRSGRTAPPAPRRHGPSTGPARPAGANRSGQQARRGRRTAYCPQPVTSGRVAPARPDGVARRLLATIGVVAASAAAVVGLGLLADAAAPQESPAVVPISAVSDAPQP